MNIKQNIPSNRAFGKQYCESNNQSINQRDTVNRKKKNTNNNKASLQINNKTKTKNYKIKRIHHDDHFSAIYTIVGNDEIHNNFYAHIMYYCY